MSSSAAPTMQRQVLDPLSVIIKLATVSYKPVGTKIVVHHNAISIQEPGPFQSVCRYVLNANKEDLHVLNWPIFQACQHYLGRDQMQRTPRIKLLFVSAQRGIHNMMLTYADSPIVLFSLHHYWILIHMHLTQTFQPEFSHCDGMSQLYSERLLEILYNVWSTEKIKIVLHLAEVLVKKETDVDPEHVLLSPSPCTSITDAAMAMRVPIGMPPSIDAAMGALEASMEFTDRDSQSIIALFWEQEKEIDKILPK